MKDVLEVLPFASVLACAPLAWTADVRVHPAPTGEPRSKDVRVTVEGQEAPVYVAQVVPADPARRWKAMFPELRDAVPTLMDPAKLRHVPWSHFESDECGALNDRLQLAPLSPPVCTLVGKLVSVDVMHGSSCNGEGDRLFTEWAGVIKENFDQAKPCAPPDAAPPHR